MRNERRATDFARPIHYIDHARGETDFLKPIGKFQCRKRGLLCGLQDAAAACGNRRSQFPSCHEQRIVPRNNLPGDTNRFTKRETQRIRGNRIHRTGNLVSQPPVVFVTTRHVGHVEFSFDDRFSAVARFEFRKHRRVLANFFRQLEEYAATIDCRRLPPRSGIKRGAAAFTVLSTSATVAEAT